MQPTLFQRLFTGNRPLYVLMAAGAVSMLWLAGSALAPTLTGSMWGVAQFVALMAVAACLGAVLGAFPGGLFLGVVLHWVERRNGAPFHEGDEVVILSKPFAGRVTRIYDVWAERHQVRVELGPAERETVTDVFSYTDVRRRPAAG